MAPNEISWGSEGPPGGLLERGHYLLRALATVLKSDSDHKAMLDKSYCIPRAGWVLVLPFDLEQGPLAASHASLNDSQNIVQ